MKNYDYINTLGYRKRLTVDTNKLPNGKYSCTLWSRDTGDFCGSGELTYKEIDELLKHYGLSADF